jgi:hypothetical protein
VDAQGQRNQIGGHLFIWEISMDSTLNLLKQKRDSALVEARQVCSRLANMDEKTLPTRTRIVLHSVERMYREHAEILDNAIKNMQAQ